MHRSDLGARQDTEPKRRVENRQRPQMLSREPIRITETDGAFEGTVMRVFSPPAASANPRCELCAGELKDRPIIGMKILRGQRRPGEPGEGEILDPDEGRVYRCTVTLTDGGAKLEVRGYVGIS